MLKCLFLRVKVFIDKGGKIISKLEVFQLLRCKTLNQKKKKRNMSSQMLLIKSPFFWIKDK